METIEGYFEQTDAALFAAADKIRSLGAKVVLFMPIPSWDEIVACAFRNCFSAFLAHFENAPRNIEELVDFNKAHAEKELNPGNENQSFLEAARDDQTTKEAFKRSIKALRSFASGRVKKLLDEYNLDVILGPCDSRTGSVGSASGFPVDNSY
ncbi:hypothetical protein M501DRAFT_1057038 [Patellaria atrata CBS 101060]|uniref:Amidase domain-containing protein n=1 Tax=Patellaria atrata CBS 101060 TaxID=1346257 RepID=A0A9P4VQD2_9PEZI|nr:hypothetical protein M501DRAFT_1057038 [Patellaria atrata CBS 101060]